MNYSRFCFYIIFAFFIRNGFCPVVSSGVPFLTQFIGMIFACNIIMPKEHRMLYSPLLNTIEDLKRLLPWKWTTDLFRKHSLEDLKLGRDLTNNMYGNNLSGSVGREFRKQYETATELKDLFDNKKYNLYEAV
jgi:hypothetical protein